MRTFLRGFVFLLILSGTALGQPKEVSDGVQGARRMAPTGSGNLSWTYTYDGAGNIIAITGNGGSAGSDTYTYDTASRLLTATVGTASNAVQYQYDAFGNRTAATSSPSATKCAGNIDCDAPVAISAATNHLSGSGISYDAAGNLTSLDSANWFEFDALSMAQAAHVSGNPLQYVYTADDERIATYGTGTWTWTIRDLEDRPLREYTSADAAIPGGTSFGTANLTWTRDYIWRGNQLLAAETRRSATDASIVSERFHLDHLGTPRLVTDDAGIILGTHRYYPFGGEVDSTTFEQPEAQLKFTGHLRDSGRSGTLSLDNMHARYFSAALGRFLSVDPVMTVDAVRSPQLWNRYAYVGNNPLNRIDPTGKVLEFSGTEEDRRKVESIANGGLNGYQLRINRNGTASLAKTKATGRETSEQKALRESLQKVIGDKATTTIYAESNTNAAVIGQFSNCTIDPADMQQFGTAQPSTASALGHEVMEQYGKQAMGMADIGYAHVWAIQYENMFTGWVRGGQTPGQRGPGGLVYGDVRYTRGDQKMDVRVTVDPQTLNVTSIVRRDVP